MQFFINLSNWSKILWLFLKFTRESFAKNFYLFILVNYCWCHHFLINVSLVKLKNLYFFMQWSKWFIFWKVFCKTIISFLELFLATCFLCILQAQLVLRFFFYFEFILLYVCKSWCITTLYYMHSHFLLHGDNKNTKKLKLLIESVKYI